MTDLALRVPHVRVLRADELRDGELVPVEIDGTPVVLVRHAGEFFAVQNNCSHRTSRSPRQASTHATACWCAPGMAAVSTFEAATRWSRRPPIRSRRLRCASSTAGSRSR